MGRGGVGSQGCGIMGGVYRITGVRVCGVTGEGLRG